MSIPEHIKKQALAAVGDKATTAQIRLYRNQGVTASPQRAEPTMGIPEHVRKLAMDATKDKTTLAELKLIEVKGHHFKPLPTPRMDRSYEPPAHVHEQDKNMDDVER